MVGTSFSKRSSQKFPMMKSVADYLSGRVGIFDLSSFSTAELEGRNAAVFSSVIANLKERTADNRPIQS